MSDEEYWRLQEWESIQKKAKSFGQGAGTSVWSTAAPKGLIKIEPTGAFETKRSKH